MQRWVGFFFTLAVVGAAFGFGHFFAGIAVATVMRVVCVVSLTLMLMLLLEVPRPARRSAARRRA